MKDGRDALRLREHELFTRDGADLYCDLPMSFAQLALGTEVEVPVLNGTQKLKIGAGSQPHQVVRLRGRGMPQLRSRSHGDCCYRLILEVPQKLNAKQREALDKALCKCYKKAVEAVLAASLAARDKLFHYREAPRIASESGPMRN